MDRRHPLLKLAANTNNASPLAMAYQVANEIMQSRDGAGFRFIVTMNGGGKTYDVCPMDADDLVYPSNGYWYWPCDCGGNTLILRHSEIASIEVYEC